MSSTFKFTCSIFLEFVSFSSSSNESILKDISLKSSSISLRGLRIFSEINLYSSSSSNLQFNVSMSSPLFSMVFIFLALLLEDEIYFSFSFDEIKFNALLICFVFSDILFNELLISIS